MRAAKKRYVKQLIDELLLLGIGGILCYLCFEGAITVMQAVWIIAGLIIAILLFKLLKKWLNKQKYLSSALSDLDKLSGESFEEYLMYMFRTQGYKVKMTEQTNDYGADLVMYKDGIKTIAQAKRYRGRVGVEAVQQIVAAKAYYNADQCMVVTNSFYTPNAINLAKANGVILMDRNELMNIKKER